MKNLLKRFLAFVLVLAMVVPAVYLSESGNEVQAAGIAKDVLKVIVQSTQGKVEGGTYDGQYVLRFTSAIDSLDYHTVGFEVTYNDNGTPKKLETTINTVYKRIASTTAGAEMTYSPKAVDTSSEYFFTAKLGVDSLDTVYTVKAFWVKEAGAEREYGPSRAISAADGQTTCTDVTVAFALETPGTEVTTAYVNGAEAEIVGYDNEYAYIKVAKAGLKSVNSLTLTAEAEGAAIGYATYRYFGNITYNGTPDTSWYDVYADSEDVTEFVIATPADLYGFAQVNTNFAGKTIYMVADIDANDGKGTATASGFTRSDGKDPYPWSPIGKNYNSATYNFAGTFDGQMHTISGIYLEKSGSANGSWGLFGETGLCNIKNFILSNSSLTMTEIANNANLGGIAGKSVGIVDTIKVDNTVYIKHGNGSKEDYTGGIVGMMSGTVPNGSKISNCEFLGQITASDYVGGIVGISSDESASTTSNMVHKKNVEIEYCLSNGTIVLDTTSNTIGGICGTAFYTQLEINNCLNLSTIDLNNFSVNTLTTGSFIGWIRNNYLNEATTTDGTENTYTAIITNSYGTSEGNWKSLGYRNSKGHTIVDGAVNAGSGALRVASSYLTAANFVGETGYNKMNLDFNIPDQYQGFWSLTNNTPVLTSFLKDETVIAIGDISTLRTVWYTNQGLSTYTLYTTADMLGFASLVKGGTDFSSKTIKLGADITMNKGTASATEFTPEVEGTELVPWTPVNVTGIFDGDGHTIRGLYLNTTVGNAGLFATVTGTVKDLRLLNSYINCTDAEPANRSSTAFLKATGSIAGSLSGTIDSVYSDAFVNHQYAYAGGLVGTVYGDGEKTPLIKNSCFAGQSTANEALGGIVGLVINTDATIEHCLNAGKVTTKTLLAGGLCGYVRSNDQTTHQLTVTDTLNVGKITTNATWCGAGFGRIIGSAADEENNIAISKSNVTVTSTYWHYEAGNALASWTTFSNLNSQGTMTMTDAAEGENSNTYHLRSNQELLAKTNINLSFQSEEAGADNTNNYWVARDGQIPMLASFEDLLTNVKY